MSLEVLVARTGDRLNVNLSTFASFDALKSWLSQEVSVPASHQIILTQHGKQARFQTLAAEVCGSSAPDDPEYIFNDFQTKVFLYDRQFISASASSSSIGDSGAVDLKEPRIEPPSDFPDTSIDRNDLKSWQSLFKHRKRWVLDVVAKTRRMMEVSSQAVDACFVIEDAVSVAVDNLKSHVQALEGHYGQAREWADHFIEEQNSVMDSLDTIISQFKSLPTDIRFARLLPLLGSEVREDHQQFSRKSATLDRFVVSGQTQKSANVARSGLKTLRQDAQALGEQVGDVVSASTRLFDSVEKVQEQSVENIEKEASELMEEVESTANAIFSDCDHVLGLTSAQQSLSTASKIAHHHTKNFLPNLQNRCLEMCEIVKDAADQRKQTSSRATRNMQKVASNEASFAQVDAQVKAFDVQADKADAFEYISLVTQLPFVYGALLLEAVRRQEWVDKMRSESASLAEDIAGYREEEERRRKKWLKNIGQFVDEAAASGNALNFEINLEAEEKAWPGTSRKTVTDYLDALRGLTGMEEVVEELDASLKELDRPTRRQIKSSKYFKNGSVHEANAGKGSFLLRDNEDLKALRNVNLKQEDEIKGHKSRIRKLEDLLYKQSQPVRANSASGVTVVEPSAMEPGSPLPYQVDHLGIGHRPGPSRRTSTTRPPEEKTLARRIVDLEAQLMEEKQKRTNLENEARDKREADGNVQAELEDTRSTKKDLMANLEDQQKEFASERRYLEEQNRKHKHRADELEDELDRVIESRHNETDDVQEKLHFLEHDVEQKKQRLSALDSEIRRRDEIQDEHDKMLRHAFTCLDSDATPPGSTAELINGLEELAERSARHSQDLAHSLSSMREEKEELQNLLDRKEKDLFNHGDRVQSLEEDLSSLKNESSADKARAESLTEELDDGRRQLRNLRAKFAEGETGSEALRQRLENQAARASDLSTQLAEAKSHINSLDVELSSLQRKHQNLVTSSNTMSKSLNHRSARAKELTSRLVAFYQELARLLESLGLSITYREGAMVIQRTSKLASASTTLPEASTSNLASTANVGTPANLQPYDTSLDSESISWIQEDSADSESERFGRLLAKIDDFNLNTFSEAVIKLRRDVEWTGKKWKIEARNYRDKYHRSQSEAHEKIAFRSFKEGDLALFLPTRNQATRPWAAFNIGAPHYFLREHDSHKLRNREWLVARITKMEERVVDLSKTLGSTLKQGEPRAAGEPEENGASTEDENPFELSDGLRWYLLDAQEEKLGAPSTPGLGKSTVASAHVDVKGSIRMNKAPAGNDASGKLNKSLESRRSSSNSKRGSISGAVVPRDSVVEMNTSGDRNAADANAEGAQGAQESGATSARPSSRASSNVAVSGAATRSPRIADKSGLAPNEEVRVDQLLGP
ncbi:MAG: oligomeric, coiled-coil, peripheral membrane protein [Alyxoria varia]|nr:MAG: oligomeric, coiled-coil, peripheral membrane protein [Alyxoria varia]